MASLVSQFKKSLQPFIKKGARYGIAVSGGGDSVSLCRLLLSIYDSSSFVALHFDHNLRATSIEDAIWVDKFCKALNITFITKKWEVPKNLGNVQQAARQARYKFFSHIAQKEDLKAIFVAHTEDDVAETFLMRLGKGSGLKGLASIKKDTVIEGVRILRPLLAHSRQELRAFLIEEKQDWLEDPSNSDKSFLRVRLRQKRDTFKELGLDFLTVAHSAGSLCRADEAIEKVVDTLYKNFVVEKKEGIELSLIFFEQPEEFSLRLLERIILNLVPAPLAPRTKKRLNLLHSLQKKKIMTLGGVKFMLTDNKILCQKEVKST